ncbi:MAG: hypothetical protein ABIQ64_02355 [Candidatus Saccharimonadales bacterium]
MEVKFININPEDIKQKLVKSGAKLVTSSRLMKRIVFGSEANPLLKCTYARIRDEGSQTTLSAKFSSMDGKISSQKEICIEIDSFDHARDLLDSFGLIVTNYQESYRETWKTSNGTLVEIEEWPNLPIYIEIESDTILKLQNVAQDLALEWSNHLVTTTDQLYSKLYGVDGKELQIMMSRLEF